jgi:hypothetical protein
MRKLLSLLILFSLLTSPVLADGGMLVRPNLDSVIDVNRLVTVGYTDEGFPIYEWLLVVEEKQLCAINYVEGMQKMVLVINTGEELKGEEAVWIFPVPAEPNKTAIDVIKGFPDFRGINVEEKAREAIPEIFSVVVSTQIYPIPLVFLNYLHRGRQTTLGMSEIAGGTDSAAGVTVHETVEKMGLTTELVSAVDGVSLSNYIVEKGLDMPSSFREILDEYTGQDYSFVISWISDVEVFKQEQGLTRADLGSTLGVFVTFPTNKIYYPLKLTSVYESERVPADVYVLDYVSPKIYSDIRADTTVKYYFDNSIGSSPDLNDFFTGYSGAGYGKYTKISMNPPSKFFTQDLWISPSTPVGVAIADFAYRNGVLFGVIVLGFCSCLASLAAGWLLFRDKMVSLLQLALFGLWNFFTVIGFASAACFLKLDEEVQVIKQSARKIIILAVLIALGLNLLNLVLSELVSWYEIIDYTFISIFDLLIQLSPAYVAYGSRIIISRILLFVFTSLLVFSLLWGYYRNRNALKFTALFSVFFILITINLQAVLLVLV